MLNNGNIFNFVTIGAIRTKYHSLGNFQFLVFEVLHAPRGKLHFLGGCTTWIGNNRLWPAERSLSFFVGLWTPPGCGLLSLDPIGRDNYERLSRQGINYPVSAVRSRLLVVLLSCPVWGKAMWEEKETQNGRGLINWKTLPCCEIRWMGSVRWMIIGANELIFSM